MGSGGGIDCFLAANQVGAAGHVIGLDMTPDMLALARKNQATLGLTNVEFVQGEMEAMPFPDASVDVVISNCVVCLSPDKDAVFREAFRVLAPGGRMHISDMMSLSGEAPTNDDLESWVACSTGAETPGCLPGPSQQSGFHGHRHRRRCQLLRRRRAIQRQGRGAQASVGRRRGFGPPLSPIPSILPGRMRRRYRMPARLGGTLRP